MTRAFAVVSLLSLLALGCSAEPGQQAAALSIPTSPTYIGLGAGPPRTGSGTAAITSLEDVSSRSAGENVIKERRLTGTLSGALQGTFAEEVRGVIRDGHVTFEGTLQVTGAIPGCGEGTFMLGLNGEGSAGLFPVTDARVRVIQHGSSTLRVGGHGTVHQEGASMSYQLQYTCQ
jgi:hypothetical protein